MRTLSIGIVFLLAVAAMSAGDASQEYRFKEFLIRYALPEAVQKNTTRLKPMFHGFDQAGSAEICATLWIERGLFSEQPIARFSFLVAARPETLGDEASLEALQSHHSDYLSKRISRENVVDIGIETIAGTRWIVSTERARRTSKVSAIRFLTFGPEGTVLSAGIVCPSDGYLPRWLLTKSRAALLQLAASIEVVPLGP